MAKITSGDFILVKGKIMHCDDWGEFMLEYGQVTNHEVRLFNHKLNAVGLGPAELEVKLKNAIFGDTGHWPLLSIEILSEGEFNLHQDDIEKGIDMYHEAIDACDKKLEGFKKRSKDVAMGTAMFSKSLIKTAFSWLI